MRNWLVCVPALLALSVPKLTAQQFRAPESCEQYQSAVTADPNNVDAAARLGRCTVRDEGVIVVNGDSTRVVFRTSWAPALRALRRAVEIDPTYTRAYRPLFRMLLSPMRDGCSYDTGHCIHVAPVLRDGDSIITPLRPVPSGAGLETYDAVQKEWEQRSRPNLEEARSIATRWAMASPNEPQSHEYLGKALLRLGEYATAADELERAAALGTPASRLGLFWDRMEALVKANRGVDARRVLDEATGDPARDTSRLPSYAFASLNSLLGRTRLELFKMTPAQRASADSIMRAQTPRARLGAPPLIRERLAAGDTTSARRLVAQFEEGPFPRVDRRLPRFFPEHLMVAQSYLAIGDTAAAESRLKAIDEPFHAAMFQFKAAMAYGGRPWVGDVWMSIGDVDAARGRRDAAAAMYRRLIGLWSGGDADVQPLVNEARVKLDALTRR